MLIRPFDFYPTLIPKNKQNAIHTDLEALRAIIQLNTTPQTINQTKNTNRKPPKTPHKARKQKPHTRHHHKKENAPQSEKTPCKA